MQIGTELRTQWHLVALLLIPLTVVFVGALYLTTNTLSLLTTLAIVQASVLAIVFSVTILGVQLIANRYSPRLTSLITSSGIFRWTFWLLVGSVGFDLLVAFVLPDLPALISAFVLTIGFLLAIISVFALWIYIRTVLERSTPRGLLEAYSQEMTPETFWDRYIESTKSSKSRHPFYDIYEMTMSALSNREWLTATSGLHTMEEVTETTIRGLSEDGILAPRSSRPANNLFNDLLQEYLPRIAVHGTEMDEEEITRSSIGVQSFVGKTGFKYNRNWLARGAAMGLRQSIRDAPNEPSGDTIRTAAFNEQGELLVTASSHPDPRIADWVLMSYRNAITQELYRNFEGFRYHGVVDSFFDEYLPEAFEHILSYYDEYYSETEVDWTQDHPNPDIENIDALSIPFSLRRSLIEVTGDALNFERRNGRYPGAKHRLQTGWQRICGIAAERAASGFAVTLFQSFIELAYIDCRYGSGSKFEWVSMMAQLWNEGHEEYVKRGIANLEELDRPKHGFQLFRAQRREDQSTGLERMLREKFSEEQDFSDWLKEFSEELESRVEGR